MLAASESSRNRACTKGSRVTPKEPPPLFNHQQELLDRTWELPAWAVFFQTGCGKTAPTIHTAARLYEAGRIDGAIVVAPNMVHRNWITDEIPLHSPISWRGLDWHSSRAKAQDRAFARLLETPKGTLPWFALTYDGLITPRGRKAAIDFLARFSQIGAAVIARGEKAVLEALARSPRVLFVVDEGSRIKNPEA
jgi:hypothetical protein